MRARVMVVAAGLLAAACIDDRTPTGPGPGQPLAEISDGAHSGGNAFFFFLPPLVANPRPGINVAGLSPVVKIFECLGTEADLCVVAAGATPIATFTTDIATTTRTQAGNSETVRQGDDHYIVNWHTRNFDLHLDQTYRICVGVGETTLGHADVDVVGSGKELRNVNTSAFVALLDDRTLPIKFRIEDGALALASDLGCGAPPPPPPTGTGEIHGTKTVTDGCPPFGCGITLDPAGWSIHLIDASGDTVATAITAADGTYEFTSLADGTYRVCEEMKFRHRQISPTGTTGTADCGMYFDEKVFDFVALVGYEVTILNGQVVLGIDFGNETFVGS